MTAGMWEHGAHAAGIILIDCAEHDRKREIGEAAAARLLPESERVVPHADQPSAFHPHSPFSSACPKQCGVLCGEVACGGRATTTGLSEKKKKERREKRPVKASTHRLSQITTINYMYRLTKCHVL
jgi:hypothetical protein